MIDVSLRLTFIRPDWLDLLSERPIPLELVNRFLGAGHISDELTLVQLGDGAAPAAGELRMTLDPSDRLRGLVAALRALKVDAGAVEHLPSPCSGDAPD